jgi:hypothetical protein
MILKILGERKMPIEFNHGKRSNEMYKTIFSIAVMKTSKIHRKEK